MTTTAPSTPSGPSARSHRSPNGDPGYVPGRGWPDTNAFRGFFAPSRIEADVFELEVEGDIPPELDGAFYRAAADTQFPPNRDDDIYINGDGMITMVRFENGHADLKTRYVRTQRFLKERQARRALVGAYRNPFTDDPRMQGVDDGNANTSVVWHGGRLLALKEAALPYELDPITLETRGVLDFDGLLPGRTFTAHPKIDPATGEMIAFSYNSSGRPDLAINIFRIARDGRLLETQTFQAPYSSMMHDWLVTKDHFIFTFSPMISDWERMRDEPQYFVWDPPKGTYVAIIPREEGVSGIRWWTSPLVMETHSLNAWSTGSEVVADHFVSDSGWFSQFPLSTDGYLREQPPFAQRWRFDLAQGAPHWTDAHATYTKEQLFDFPGDMPRVDPGALMGRNRHSWMGCMNPALGPMPPFGPMGPPFNSIVHRDDETGTQTGYFVGEDAAPEEPVFVPKGPNADEGEGWLLSLVGRRRENRNDMIILDALDVAAGPVATIKFPFRIRYGFHGTWVPGHELRRL